MPGGALPSGTNWSLFLNQLVYNLYMEKEKMKPKKADTDNENDDGNEAGIDDIGGSVAKKAGANPYTEDPEERNDSEDSAGSHGNSVADATECGGKRGYDTNNENEMNDGGADHDDDDDDDEHGEPTALDTFFPAIQLVGMTIGVLSDDFDILLNHAIDRGEVEESNLVAVPSQAQCKVSARTDLLPAASLASAVSSPSNVSSSIEQSRVRASYKRGI